MINLYVKVIICWKMTIQYSPLALAPFYKKLFKFNIDFFGARNYKGKRNYYLLKLVSKQNNLKNL